MTTENAQIAVLGVGNLLLKDEGVGVHVVQALQKSDKLPSNVRLIDGGTATLDTLHLIEDMDKIIVIDAVKGGCAPGTIYRFTAAEVEFAGAPGAEAPAYSLHELSLSSTLAIGKLLGGNFKSVVIIGVEPREVALGLELSPEIEGKMDRLIELTLKEIQEVSDIDSNRTKTIG